MSRKTSRRASAEPRISLVIPAYQEGVRLPVFLEQLAAEALRHLAVPIEVVVSDDGSTAENAALEEAAVVAAQKAMDEAGAPHRFRFHRAKINGGKGSAVRGGWDVASASAEWLAFTDADGSVSASEFFRIVQTLDAQPAEVVAASRVKMAGRQVERRLFRHLQGRVFATLIEQAFGLGFYDTQCGLKFARAEWLRPLLPQLREQGFMIDVEVLFALQRAGARFVEVPVDWIDSEDSRVRFGIDAAKMLVAIARVRRYVRGLDIASRRENVKRLNVAA